MRQLKIKIKESGLKQNFIARKVSISSSHLTMMLNEKATMPERVRNQLNQLLSSYLLNN